MTEHGALILRMANERRMRPSYPRMLAVGRARRVTVLNPATRVLESWTETTLRTVNEEEEETVTLVLTEPALLRPGVLRDPDRAAEALRA